MSSEPAAAPAIAIAVDAELRRRVAANVRALRKAAGFTVKYVAARGELHWRLWQKVEAGRTNATLFTMIRVAHALDVDPAVLLRELPAE